MNPHKLPCAWKHHSGGNAEVNPQVLMLVGNRRADFKDPGNTPSTNGAIHTSPGHSPGNWHQMISESCMVDTMGSHSCSFDAWNLPVLPLLSPNRADGYAKVRLEQRITQNA